MHRIDTPTATGGGLWQPSNPSVGQLATRGDADWFNDLQENVMGVLTAGDVAPTKGNHTDLPNAIAAMIAAAAGDIQAAAVAAAEAAVPAAVAAQNLIHVGDVVFRAVNAVPAGWLECNGQAVTRAAYPALYAAIGTTYGPGDGASTFNVPDLRGEFIRGFDDGRGVDTGRAFGSAQSDASQGHFHSLNGSSGVLPAGTAGNGFTGSAGTNVSAPVTQTGSPITDGINGAPRTAAETRPVNVAMLPLIKSS